MNQQAEQSIIEMMNCFPQTSQDYRLLLGSLAKLCDGLTDQAIIEAAGRFASGDVPEQSLKFAPSAPEFVAEARKRQEFVDLRALPRLAPPTVDYRPGSLSPLMVRQQRALSENADCPIILENASLEDFKRMSKAGQLPVGSRWVATLAIIFGPRQSSNSTGREAA